MLSSMLNSTSATVQVLSVLIRENSDSYCICIDIPGVDESNINILVSKSYISIEAFRSPPSYEVTQSYINECMYGYFYRQMSLPHNIDDSTISTEFDQGYLRINVPKIISPSSKLLITNECDDEKSMTAHLEVKSNKRDYFSDCLSTDSNISKAPRFDEKHVKSIAVKRKGRGEVKEYCPSKEPKFHHNLECMPDDMMDTS